MCPHGASATAPVLAPAMQLAGYAWAFPSLNMMPQLVQTLQPLAADDAAVGLVLRDLRSPQVLRERLQCAGALLLPMPAGACCACFMFVVAGG